MAVIHYCGPRQVFNGWLLRCPVSLAGWCDFVVWLRVAELSERILPSVPE